MKRYPVAAFIADVHWSARCPAYRKEKEGSFYAVTEAKMVQMRDIIFSELKKCHHLDGDPSLPDGLDSFPVFVAGDLFDCCYQLQDLWSFKKMLQKTFVDEDAWPAEQKDKWCGITMFGIHGQHDMRYHDEKNDCTVFDLLQTYPWMPFISLEGRDDLEDNRPYEEVMGIPEDTGRKENGIPVYDVHSFIVYGAGWNKPLPTKEELDAVITTCKANWKTRGDSRCDEGIKGAEPSPRIYNATFTPVALVHKSLWYKTPVYPGQIEGNVAVESVTFHNAGFEMVFSGDNHTAFDVTVGGVRFYNLGAFTRRSVAVANQQPRFVMLYSDGTTQNFEVGKPASEVFDLSMSDDDKERVLVKDGFADALASKNLKIESFKETLGLVSKQGEIGKMKLTDNQRELLRDIISEL